jgi:hypothetical protein
MSLFAKAAATAAEKNAAPPEPATSTATKLNSARADYADLVRLSRGAPSVGSATESSQRYALERIQALEQVLRSEGGTT